MVQQCVCSWNGFDVLTLLSPCVRVTLGVHRRGALFDLATIYLGDAQRICLLQQTLAATSAMGHVCSAALQSGDWGTILSMLCCMVMGE